MGGKMMEELVKIQADLKAPKGQRNDFGKYNYRSCEDILTAVKPLLSDNGCYLVINDDIVMLGNRFYVKATVTIFKGSESVTTVAFAREPDTKKGMDEAQITGATSSYARKYALNGLFAIDDTKDADATNTHGKEVVKNTRQQPDRSQHMKSIKTSADFEIVFDREVHSPDEIDGWKKKYCDEINKLSPVEKNKLKGFVSDNMKRFEEELAGQEA
jgi:hypothetical protein